MPAIFRKEKIELYRISALQRIKSFFSNICSLFHCFSVRRTGDSSQECLITITEATEVAEVASMTEVVEGVVLAAEAVEVEAEEAAVHAPQNAML
jgi:hypothetical protein